MAQAVAEAIEDHAPLVVEAGTGVGKTFAYLVPALLSGERVVVSTATKALQDQLYGRDLPLLLRALALPLRTALLKGRASYLCLHRLEQARQDPVLRWPSVAQTLARIEQWAQTTRSGDLAELPALDERSAAIPLVTSTRDNCLGATARVCGDCHVYQARREALAADVVVINHHLFFADLAVRESGVAELLPTRVRVVVFDEAHQLNETGSAVSWASSWAPASCWIWRGTCWRRACSARVAWPTGRACATLEQAARDLRLLVADSASRCGPGGCPGTARRPMAWMPRRAWRDALAQAGHQPVRPGLAALDGGVRKWRPTLAACTSARWRLAGAPGAVFRARPCAPGRALAGCGPAAPGRGAAGSGPGPACTVGKARRPRPAPGTSPWRHWRGSAPGSSPRPRWATTMQLRWFTEPCGWRAHASCVWTVRLTTRARPRCTCRGSCPPPRTPRTARNWPIGWPMRPQRLGGRTLVLTTSLRALQVMAGVLQQRLAVGGGIEVLVQGQAPKRQIMECFRAPADAVGHVLVGSASFWEGFDVPGDALQLVVIDKLPFPARPPIRWCRPMARASSSRGAAPFATISFRRRRWRSSRAPGA